MLPAMALSSGTRLGPYEIVFPLGAGGMGEVYRAKDTRLDRDVAVKILPEGFAGSELMRARFEREAKSISSLNHASICTLYDVGHHDSLLFLVMELIEGESLADRLAKGALPPDQVVKFGAQIADALDHAHKQGIVHRDLKPGNVMLTKSGAKLLDFGLARTATEGRETAQGMTSHPSQTQEAREDRVAARGSDGDHRDSVRRGRVARISRRPDGGRPGDDAFRGADR
jgi:serine/threonine protein kinase